MDKQLKQLKEAWVLLEGTSTVKLYHGVPWQRVKQVDAEGGLTSAAEGTTLKGSPNERGLIWFAWDPSVAYQHAMMYHNEKPGQMYAANIDRGKLKLLILDDLVSESHAADMNKLLGREKVQLGYHTYKMMFRYLHEALDLTIKDAIHKMGWRYNGVVDKMARGVGLIVDRVGVKPINWKPSDTPPSQDDKPLEKEYSNSGKELDPEWDDLLFDK